MYCVSCSNIQPTSVYWVMGFPISAVRNMSKTELQFLKAIKAMMRLLIAMENKPPIACNSFNEVSEFLLTGIKAVGKLLDSYLRQPTDPTLLTWGDHKTH